MESQASNICHSSRLGAAFGTKRQLLQPREENICGNGGQCVIIKDIKEFFDLVIRYVGKPSFAWTISDSRSDDQSWDVFLLVDRLAVSLSKWVFGSCIFKRICHANELAYAASSASVFEEIRIVNTMKFNEND